MKQTILINKTNKQLLSIEIIHQKKLDEKLILKIKNYCKKKLIKFYLSNNIQIAIKLNLDGAYIPSFNKNLKHLAYSV